MKTATKNPARPMRCVNCSAPIRSSGDHGMYIHYDNHTVCDWTEDMEPTDRVATARRTTTWANVETEGCRCAVEPFASAADADLFRSVTFNCPVGSSSLKPDGERMTVRQFQDGFRVDFSIETPRHWHAR